MTDSNDGGVGSFLHPGSDLRSERRGNAGDGQWLLKLAVIVRCRHCPQQQRPGAIKRAALWRRQRLRCYNNGNGNMDIVFQPKFLWQSKGVDMDRAIVHGYQQAEQVPISTARVGQRFSTMCVAPQQSPNYLWTTENPGFSLTSIPRMCSVHPPAPWHMELPTVCS